VTLIVARIDENSIYIESDSRITDESKVKNDPLCGLLKTLILHPFFCVSFAGNVHYAEEAIKRYFIAQKTAATIDEVLEMLLKLLVAVNIESGKKTDFILASVIDKVPKLYRIEGGELSKDLTVAWIGDIDGFEYYQAQYHMLSGDIENKDRMRKAFESVIENSELNSIGDFQVSTYINHDINPKHPVFIHGFRTKVDITEAQVITIHEKNKPEPLPLGSVEGGSHGISYLATVDPTYCGVAIHFMHGNFGILFCPQLSFNGIVFKDTDGESFVNAINEKYKIPLRGLVRMGGSALKYMDTRKFESARKCTEEKINVIDNEILIKRLAFRCNQKSKGNIGTQSDIHRILEDELDITPKELKVFELTFLISHGLSSSEDKIRNCLEALHLNRKDSIGE